MRAKQHVTPLLSAREAATILGVSTKTLKSFDLCHIEIGKRWKYDSNDIQTYVRKQRRSPCRSIGAKAHPIISTTSNSKVVGFAEAVERTRRKKRNR